MGDSILEQALSCWLTLPGEKERVDGVCLSLVELTINKQPHFSEAIIKAGKGNHKAAYSAALALLEDNNTVDLGRCWLWVSASLGSIAAARELAEELTLEGSEGKLQRSQSEIISLVRTWLQRANAMEREQILQSSSVEPKETGGLFQNVNHPMADSRPGYTVPSLEEPGVVVVETIGDPYSKEGLELAKRYNHLIGKSLPFRGVLPDPEEFAEEMLTVFPWVPTLARYLQGQLSILHSSNLEFPKLPPLLLVGPSGSGKTTILEWIANKCQMPNMTIPVGGTHDSAGLTAISRGWVSAKPAGPVEIMADSECCNPAIILDEVDKGVSDASGRNGSVMGVLLTMLQPPAGGYRDACLLANVDLTNITFMGTANSLSALTDTFRKRFLVQEIPAPGPEHFEQILPRVIAKEAARLGMPTYCLPLLGPGDEAWLKSVYEGSHCSIRQLEQAFRVINGENAAAEAELRKQGSQMMH
ncbi:AAA family ATPase [Thalassospira xiamenensis]|uniref:ATPase family associated with various cellular activities (AAA) n=1 Tax=Thalassospira xiamenensis TaxID=220697 RepID=A0A285TTY3_9PROT|nr:AAA family ATPase [Thalassospira xiamenensis]SOC26803.1 ATPase family associated with various cellular activities (AAA) [Thalassospira xiamenensis]